MSKGNLLGVVLIVLGLLVFSSRWDVLNGFLPSGDPGRLFGYYWATLFVLPLGLLFHFIGLIGGKRTAGWLIPGGILVVAAVICQISMLTDGWGVLWPGFILAVAVGLLEFYLFGSRNPVLLIPVAILGGVSIVFFSMTLSVFSNFLQSAIAVLLVGLGVLVMFRKNGKGSEKF